MVRVQFGFVTLMGLVRLSSIYVFSTRFLVQFDSSQNMGSSWFEFGLIPISSRDLLRLYRQACYWYYINGSFTTEEISQHIEIYLHPSQVETVQNLVEFITRTLTTLQESFWWRPLDPLHDLGLRGMTWNGIPQHQSDQEMSVQWRCCVTLIVDGKVVDRRFVRLSRRQCTAGEMNMMSRTEYKHSPTTATNTYSRLTHDNRYKDNHLLIHSNQLSFEPATSITVRLASWYSS